MYKEPNMRITIEDDRHRKYRRNGNAQMYQAQYNIYSRLQITALMTLWVYLSFVSECIVGRLVLQTEYRGIRVSVLSING